MIARVAKELHITLTEAFSLPASEIMLWQAVFEMEYEEMKAVRGDDAGKENLSADDFRSKLKTRVKPSRRR